MGDVFFGIPVRDASIERDTKQRGYLLEDWFVEQCFGVLSSLIDPRVWSGTDEQVQTAIGAVQDQIFALMNEDAVISDIRIEGCELQKFVGGEWVSIGAFGQGLTLTANTLEPEEPATIDLADCELILGIPQGFQGFQGIQGEDGQSVEQIFAETLPAGSEATAEFVNEILTIGIPRGDTGAQGAGGSQAAYTLPDDPQSDVICKAAWYMARQYSDDFQDHIQIVKFAIEQSEAYARGALEALDNIAFWIQDALIAITTVTAGVLLAAIEYLENNIIDDDAVRLAAEQFYCAILATYESEPQFSDFFSQIDYPLDFPPPDINFDSETGEWLWDNLGDLADFVVGLGTGESAGWGIVAWAQIHNTLMPEFVQPLFISAPFEAMLKLVINNSEVFAEANCLNFCDNWEHDFNFATDNGGFSAYLGNVTGNPYGTYSNPDWLTAYNANNDPFTELRIRRADSPPSRLLTEIEIFFVSSGDLQVEVSLNVIANVAAGTHHLIIPVDFFGEEDYRIDLSNLSADAPASLQRIIFRGTGADPF